MTKCIMETVVDAHFGGTITTEKETELRRHLVDCERCRRRYERRALLAKLDPAALSPEARIGRALGLVEPKVSAPQPADAEPRRRVVAFLATGLAAAAAVALFIARPAGRDSEFTARGALTHDAAMRPHLEVFRARPGHAPVRTEDAMRASDELAFAYVGQPGKPHLAVFGVDEHGHVFWFHPAWTDPKANPESIPAPALAGSERHELREAVGHTLDGQRLELHGLFSERAMTVKEIEGALAGRTAPLGALRLSGATDYVVSLSVTP